MTNAFDGLDPGTAMTRMESWLEKCECERCDCPRGTGLLVCAFCMEGQHTPSSLEVKGGAR